MALKDLIKNTVEKLDDYIKNWQEKFFINRANANNYFNSLVKKFKGEVDEVRDITIYRGSLFSFYAFKYSSISYHEYKTLSFYDAHPVDLVISNRGNYFTGLNWHYVNPLKKAQILKYLILNFQESFFEDKPLFPLNYKKLLSILGSNRKYINYAIKTYRKDRIIKSRGVQVMRISNEDILNTISMTPAQWVGITDSEIKQIIKKVNSGQMTPYEANKMFLNR